MSQANGAKKRQPTTLKEYFSAGNKFVTRTELWWFLNNHANLLASAAIINRKRRPSLAKRLIELFRRNPPVVTPTPPEPQPAVEESEPEAEAPRKKFDAMGRLVDA